MDEIQDSELIRAKVEEALRFFVKTLPIPLSIQRAENPAEAEAFLEIPGPRNESIEFFERDGRVEMNFGFGGESFDFAGITGDDDEDVDPETAEAEAEEDFKDELEALVNATLDVIEETVFSAQYSKLSVQMGGLFPAEDFEGMKGFDGFESVSWNGKYDLSPKA
jgi:hypothetical protein